ncbi:DUF3137 domain-containing protein [bacterium]|nr:DUF3137 domain-containing protein [bacterium]
MYISAILYLARGGGGGSSGGGGGGFSGGSSGSGSGEGGAFWFFGAVGYIPIAFIASYFARKNNPTLKRIVSASLLGLLTIVVAVFAGAWCIVTFLGGVLGYVLEGAGVHARVKTSTKQVVAKLQAAASKDTAWDEQKLRAMVQYVFDMYQADWSSFNLARMQTYTTPEYFAHMRLVLTALKAMGRQNDVQKPKLISQAIVDLTDDNNNQLDIFRVGISAQANDKLIDLLDNNKTIYTDSSSWSETWEFHRNGNGWLLANIYQSTASQDSRTTALTEFAQQNQFFYNEDFGWLLLPKRGQLFSEADFMRSDVNNHVIGLYRNVLVEFYSYRPAKGSSEYYVIAQAVLPKSYGNIVVRRKNGRWQGKIKGLNALSTEANAFNKMYDIFADNVEQVTAFELLHPLYMEKLIALQYEVNIEVVDNMLYLYSTDAGMSYESMLELLKAAFAEMKM